MKKTLHFKNMNNLMKDSLITDKGKNIRFIKDVVSAYYDMDISMFDIKTSRQENVKIRHVTIYLCKKKLDMGFTHIGKAFNIDHSTVMYITRKIEGYLEWDKELRTEIDEIENILTFKAIDELKIEEDYYYIPLNEFYSIKQEDGKAIILKGFTEKEIEALQFKDKRSGNLFFNKEAKPKKHVNQKFYILEKKTEEQTKDEKRDEKKKSKK